MATELIDNPEVEEDETDVEEEPTGRSGVAKPWDPKKIRITTKNFSLREVVEQIQQQETDLAPDFQRGFVWKNRQKTRLIESLLLGIPLPAFYFNQESDGTYQVVDGVQRLTTIRLFMEDKHVLEKEDLEYLEHLGGANYSKLDTATSRRFKAAQIVVHIIEPQTPEDVKYDIFGRVNTLGSPLSAQEIRHAMSKSRSRALLTRLSELGSFENATGRFFWKRMPDGARIRDGHRMTDRELALRFCAFRGYAEEDYRAHSSLDAFLVDFTRRLDERAEANRNIPDERLLQLERDFDQAMRNAYSALGQAAFRRWPTGVTRRGPINRAVFESQALALADYREERVAERSAEITEAFRALFSDVGYLRSVTVGTGDPASIALRLNRTRQAVEAILR